jgi:hypothetical protein
MGPMIFCNHPNLSWVESLQVSQSMEPFTEMEQWTFSHYSFSAKIKQPSSPQNSPWHISFFLTQKWIGTWSQQCNILFMIGVIISPFGTTGWKVMLTDKTSHSPVTTCCTSKLLTFTNWKELFYGFPEPRSPMNTKSNWSPNSMMTPSEISYWRNKNGPELSLIQSIGVVFWTLETVAPSNDSTYDVGTDAP